ADAADCRTDVRIPQGAERACRRTRRVTDVVAMWLSATRWTTDGLGMGERWSCAAGERPAGAEVHLSEFWETRCRAAKLGEKRLDGISQVVHTGAGNLGCRGTRSSSQTDGAVPTCG